MHFVIAAFVAGCILFIVKSLLKKDSQPASETPPAPVQEVKGEGSSTKTENRKIPAGGSGTALPKPVFAFQIEPNASIKNEDFVKWEGGKTIIRLLTTPLTLRQHYIGVVGSKPVCCPKKLVDGTWKGDCPICEHYHDLWALYGASNDSSTKDSLTETIRKIKPVLRAYFVVSIKEGEVWSKPKWWSVGITILNEISKFSSYSESAPLYSPRDGHALIVHKETKYNFPVYKIIPTMKPVPFSVFKDTTYLQAQLQSLMDGWASTPQEMQNAMRQHLRSTTRGCVSCSTLMTCIDKEKLYCSKKCFYKENGGRTADKFTMSHACRKCSLGFVDCFHCKSLPDCKCLPTTLRDAPLGCKCDAGCKAAVKR